MISRVIFRLLLLILSGCWVCVTWANQQALVVPLQGPIGPAVAYQVQSTIEQADIDTTSVIILQIDTPGGLSQSMRQIIKAMLASPIPIVGYVAPSGARAASAGTFILYACHLAAMAPGTNLGAATPVNVGGSSAKPSDDKEATLSASQKKAMNDATAYIRSLAQLRGRNEAWAEMAVTQASSLSAQEALNKGVINFVSPSLTDLLTQIDGQKITVNDHTVTLHTADNDILRVKRSWREQFLAVITNPTLAYLLLVIGAYGLFLEFTHPGLIIPGVVGVVAALIGVYGLNLLPVNYVGLALVLLGLVFFVCEAFVTSYGVLAMGGIVSFFIGSLMLFDEQSVGYHLSIGVVIAVTILLAVMVLTVIAYLYRSRQAPVVTGQQTLLGLEGRVLIDKNGVWLKLHGELWRIDNPEGLESGQAVVVTAVNGLRLTVATSAR